MANLETDSERLRVRNESRVQREARIRCLHQTGDFGGAATLALQLYGVEMARYLSMRLRRQPDAEDAFSQFCEDMWRGFRGFDWRCSLRTWLATLAHHAASRLRSAAYRRREATLCAFEEDTMPVEEESSSPTAHLCGEVKRRVLLLRSQLPSEQQTLLTLRIDRALSWRELAITLDNLPADTQELELERAAARLRTRFGYVKRRLRALAQEDGLFSSTSDGI